MQKAVEKVLCVVTEVSQRGTMGGMWSAGDDKKAIKEAGQALRFCWIATLDLFPNYEKPKA